MIKSREDYSPRNLKRLQQKYRKFSELFWCVSMIFASDIARLRTKSPSFRRLILEREIRETFADFL